MVPQYSPEYQMGDERGQNNLGATGSIVFRKSIIIMVNVYRYNEHVPRGLSPEASQSY